jgi:hypothetical protein
MCRPKGTNFTKLESVDEILDSIDFDNSIEIEFEDAVEMTEISTGQQEQEHQLATKQEPDPNPNPIIFEI